MPRQDINMQTENNKDLLTGFIDAKTFDNLLKINLEKAIKNGESLSLAMLDMDNLRKFNEEYGTQCGHLALSKLAKLIKSRVPERMVPTRFGGEEFVIIFPRTEREEAFLIIEKIRSEWDTEHEFIVNKEEINANLTFSAGISSYPADGTTAIDLLRKAEQALYRAKVNGRNRVCIAQEEKMIPKTAHYTATQLERLSLLAKNLSVTDALLLREALDCLLRKYTISEKLK